MSDASKNFDINIRTKAELDALKKTDAAVKDVGTSVKELKKDIRAASDDKPFDAVAAAIERKAERMKQAAGVVTTSTQEILKAEQTLRTLTSNTSPQSRGESVKPYESGLKPYTPPATSGIFTPPVPPGGGAGIIGSLSLLGGGAVVAASALVNLATNISHAGEEARELERAGVEMSERFASQIRLNPTAALDGMSAKMREVNRELADINDKGWASRTANFFSEMMGNGGDTAKLTAASAERKRLQAQSHEAAAAMLERSKAEAEASHLIAIGMKEEGEALQRKIALKQKLAEIDERFKFDVKDGPFESDKKDKDAAAQRRQALDEGYDKEKLADEAHARALATHAQLHEAKVQKTAAEAQIAGLLEMHLEKQAQDLQRSAVAQEAINTAILSGLPPMEQMAALAAALAVAAVKQTHADEEHARALATQAQLFELNVQKAALEAQAKGLTLEHRKREAEDVSRIGDLQERINRLLLSGLPPMQQAAAIAREMAAASAEQATVGKDRKKEDDQALADAKEKMEVARENLALDKEGAAAARIDRALKKELFQIEKSDRPQVLKDELAALAKQTAEIEKQVLEKKRLNKEAGQQVKDAADAMGAQKAKAGSTWQEQSAERDAQKKEASATRAAAQNLANKWAAEQRANGNVPTDAELAAHRDALIEADGARKKPEKDPQGLASRLAADAARKKGLGAKKKDGPFGSPMSEKDIANDAPVEPGQPGGEGGAGEGIGSAIAGMVDKAKAASSDMVAQLTAAIAAADFKVEVDTSAVVEAVNSAIESVRSELQPQIDKLASDIATL